LSSSKISFLVLSIAYIHIHYTCMYKKKIVTIIIKHVLFLFLNVHIFLYMLFLELLMLPNNIMLLLINYIICKFVFIIYY